jgi:hypothetical protein
VAKARLYRSTWVRHEECNPDAGGWMGSDKTVLSSGRPIRIGGGREGIAVISHVFRFSFT